jgi:putative oxidoreductase
MSARSIVSWLLRLGLGGLFIFAGVLKMEDPTQFALEVVNYRLFSSLAPYLAVTLPAVETLIGVGVIVFPAPWRRASALAIAGLMAAFTVAVVAAVTRHINIDCGCFGGKSGPVSWLTVGRDLALLAGALALYRLSAPSDGARVTRT